MVDPAPPSTAEPARRAPPECRRCARAVRDAAVKATSGVVDCGPRARTWSTPTRCYLTPEAVMFTSRPFCADIGSTVDGEGAIGFVATRPSEIGTGQRVHRRRSARPSGARGRANSIVGTGGSRSACRGMKMLLGGSVRPRAYGPWIRDRGLLGRTQTGRPFSAMGFEPVLVFWPPLRLAWIEPR
jgi:hypothetical protein